MNLKQKLSKKLKKSGGFTLIEMLIVVAIIAILVAVSIPMVGSALERARVATDAANERAAKAAAMIDYMTKDKTGEQSYVYDADKGTVTEGNVTTAPEPTYGQCSKHKDGYIVVTINDQEAETIKVTWYNSEGSEVANSAHGSDTTVPTT